MAHYNCNPYTEPTDHPDYLFHPSYFSCPPPPTLYPVNEADLRVTGRGIPSMQIIVVYPNRTRTEAIVDKNGIFVADTLTAPCAGEVIFAYQSEVDAKYCSLPSVVTVSAV